MNRLVMLVPYESAEAFRATTDAYVDGSASFYMAPEVNNIRFDGMTAWVGDGAIEADGGHHITVTRSHIYRDHPYWIFWSDMKDPSAPADLLRSTAIALRDGTNDWEISYSHLRYSGQDLISHLCRQQPCGGVNGRVNGSDPTGPGQIVNGNLYWKVNTIDADPLLSTYDTVTAVASATGLERDRLGSVPGQGTDPGFAAFKLDVVDNAKATAEPRSASEVFTPSDLLRSPGQPGDRRAS